MNKGGSGGLMMKDNDDEENDYCEIKDRNYKSSIVVSASAELSENSIDDKDAPTPTTGGG